MKDNILRIWLVLLIIFLLSFRLVVEIKKAINDRRIWQEVFREINWWDIEGTQLKWKNTLFISDTLYMISNDGKDTNYIVCDTVRRCDKCGQNIIW